MTRVIIRGFSDGACIFTESRGVEDSQAEAVFEELGYRHADLMSEDKPWMVEIEFPDEPVSERFFRFGSDPRGMVEPLAVIISKVGA
jgi:hypothetical protein